jgi:undecaprenyl phosphate-alpha-L-ara4N flippase subunit ArnE
METRWFAILLMVICTLFTSAAQILYKFGAAKLPLIFTNYHLLGGLFLYAIGALIFVIALKFGEVTVLYPIIATSYIWVALLSAAIFSEIINVYKGAGIALIFIGITVIAAGSKKKGIVKYVDGV